MAQSKRGIRIVIGSEPQTLTAQEMRQKAIMQIARKIVRLEDERRKLRKRLKDIGVELRAQKRAQKVVLAPVFTPDDVVGFDSRLVPQQVARLDGTHEYIENNEGIDACATCGKSQRSKEHTR